MEGTFAFTLDTELMWGSLDRLSVPAFERRYPDMRGTIRAILAELDAFAIPATWAVVGHLMLDHCERGNNGRAHTDLERPTHRWFPGDWLRVDPCTDRGRDPLWYGDDIVEWIQDARTRHEIGSHSFSHPIFGDAGVSHDVARSELRACLAAAQARGITLRSFVFPRNREGHHDVLRDAGFTAFRGADRTWFDGYPRMAARGAHFADQALGVAPRVSQPIERLPGLWDIPGSMLLLHRVGARRWIPMASRVRKARRGMQVAARDGGVFHLWTHPMNLANEREAMLAGLRSILREAADLRDRGTVRIATMGEIAATAAAATPGVGASTAEASAAGADHAVEPQAFRSSR